MGNFGITTFWHGECHLSTDYFHRRFMRSVFPRRPVWLDLRKSITGHESPSPATVGISAGCTLNPKMGKSEGRTVTVVASLGTLGRRS